jgi:hypothetical protein
VRLQYEVRNSLHEPIYVFARLYDMRAQKHSRNCANIAIEGQKATVSQQVWLRPLDCAMTARKRPTAGCLLRIRRRAASFLCRYRFSNLIPIIRCATREEKKAGHRGRLLADVSNWLGLASQLRGGSLTELEGQKLTLFPFYEALAKQQFAESEAMPLG